MIQAEFYFFGSLNDFLPPNQKAAWIRLSFSPHQSIKHLVESMRIPHTEIGVVLVNKVLTPCSQLLQEGDRVEIYPPGSNKRVLGFVSEESNDQIDPNGDITSGACFLLDNHLGKLAIYLRILGFDTWYRNDYQDQELAKLTEQTGRILLTRDRGLLMRKQVKQGYCIRSLDPKTQLAEVLDRYDLLERIRAFTRCLRCNFQLEIVHKQEIEHRLLPLTRKYYQKFFLCNNCNQIYWRGSHFERMQRFVDQLREQDTK